METRFKIFAAAVFGVFMLSSCGSTAPDFAYKAAETTAVSEASESELTVSETVSDKTITASEMLLSSEKYTPSDEERLQIQNLLINGKKIFYDYIDGKEICKHKNENSFITTQEIADNGIYEGQTVDRIWYEVVDGDVMTISDLTEKLTPIFTEKMINYLKAEIDDYYYEENGRLYISESAGSNGGLLGTDTVHIDSVGKVDESTLVLYMTAFGAGENWDMDHDTAADFTVLLKRTDGGLKIDECSSAAFQYIEWCYKSEDDIF
ncbi:MAG: hypothetical protein ACI4I1_00645 [Oscillospiraceae bacterium]